mgnify:FL=1|jgi:hypothetical protein
MNKTCYICKESLPLDLFYLSKNGNYNFCCTPCDKIRKIKYRRENKTKIALADHKYINTERGYVGEVINGVFQRGRRNNGRKKWVPEITKQELYDELMLYIQDYGRKCEYCKESWTYQRALGVRGQKNTARKRGGIESNFSIDRLDSTETYKRGNIVFCCVGCNNRKNQVRLGDVLNILTVAKKRGMINEME